MKRSRHAEGTAHFMNKTTASAATGTIPTKKMAASTRRSRIANHP